MVKCPSCGIEVDKPLQILKNDSFNVETYECNKCHDRFEIIINQ